MDAALNVLLSASSQHTSRDLPVELDALVHHPDQANTAWGDVHRTHMFSCAGVVRARAGACLAKLRNDEMTR